MSDGMKNKQCTQSFKSDIMHVFYVHIFIPFTWKDGIYKANQYLYMWYKMNIITCFEC